LIECQGALRIRNATELEQAVSRLFSEPELRDRMGRAGHDLVQSGQGALNRTLELIDGLITPATG